MIVFYKLWRLAVLGEPEFTHERRELGDGWRGRVDSNKSKGVNQHSHKCRERLTPENSCNKVELKPKACCGVDKGKVKRSDDTSRR